ncbi:MAG TPA: hypothetical protein VIY28_08525 [Pseudonocardiaceae bacterium]
MTGETGSGACCFGGFVHLADVPAVREQLIVLLPDGTYGYRVVRPDWDAMMTALRRREWNALALPNIDRGMRDPVTSKI